jgi:hypothetical protein
LERERGGRTKPSLFICSLRAHRSNACFFREERPQTAAVERTMMSELSDGKQRMRSCCARERKDRGRSRKEEEEEEGGCFTQPPFGSSLFFTRRIRTDAGGREVREGRVELVVCVEKVFC